MHECNSESVFLVNAEVDSMGGVVDGGAGIGVETSPHRAAIEKAQAALRQEYDVREERRRELEFLEKGGNPLDFKFGNAACASVQSTSLTDQHPEQFVTSEAKGSFALTASPRGDSVESSGRPRTRTDCEPNSADNLLLFDGDNELPEHKKNSIRPGKRNNIAPSKQNSQISARQNGRVSEDSTIFRPYARRNRSKSIRDGTRSNSTEIVHSRGGHGSLVSRGGSRDPKGTICEANKQKEQKTPSFSNPKSSSSNGNIVSKIVTSDKQLDVELDGKQGITISTSLGKGSLPENKLDVGASKGVVDNQQPQPTHADGQQPPVDADAERPDLTEVKEQLLSAAIEGIPCAVTTVSGSEAGYGPENGSSNSKGDRKKIPNEVQNTSSAAFGMKGLDSESSCTQTSLCLDVNNDSDVCTNKRNVNSNGNSTEQKFKSEGSPNVVGGEILEETNETKTVDSGANVNDDPCSIYQNHVGNGSMVKVEEEIHSRVSDEQNQVKCTSNMGLENNSHSLLENDKREGNVLGDSNDSIVNKENSSARRSQSFVDVSAHDLPVTALLGKDSVYVPDCQTSENSLNLVNKAREDSVLEEARIIEAKRQRIAELSVGTMPLENRRASHWEFVLEEMAWLANDFAQERLWKITAAAQMSRMAASASRLRFEKQNQHWKLKKVAHTLANAVMQFWHLAEVHLNSDISSVALENRKFDLIVPSCTSGNETSEGKIEKPVTTNKALEYSLGKSLPLAVQGYAIRFLKSASSPVPPFQAEAEATPEDITVTDIGSSDMSWEDRLTEEILFYTVPSGAMEAYRNSIESHLVQCENTCSSMQEEVDTHMYDAIAEYGYQESTYDEDEGETSTYYLPGAFEGSKPSKFAQKKRNNLTRPYSARSYEMATDVPYGHLTTGPQQSMPMGKRPATNLNVGAIPTKRMRTATRQRFVSPFGTGGTGGVQVPAKTDASSGDTSSFQDDQYTLHGESQMQRSVEVESATDFEKQMRYDSAETSTKPKKKKKKPKHLGTAYDQGWQLDSNVNRVQSNNFKKRTESHHFESNGTTGLYGQHIAKRPKIMKHPLDNAFDNIAHMNGSIPSPVASMSNMSNPNKFIKLMGGRDRGRKAKGLKISAGQPGSGSPWTLFEDQALVVLVHDMGPNWDLVSDAVNTTLQFKCIFRKPKECKERHKILMDRSASDGADSAEDSGSSQSYPSSLPGIPKGSARQLFQCLQGPMVEDTLKSHFEKIIIIEQKQYYRSQNDYQDPKQIAPVHNSHIIALSQAFPNNLNGSVLTPLDLCDTTPSSPDFLPLGYQGSQAGGLAMSNQSAVASTLPTSGPNSSLQGSSSIALGSNLQSPTGPLGAAVRDGRFGVPRTPTPDDHQRMQQYNKMLSGRNPQQPNLSVPGALSGSDRGVRLNGMGMMHGMSRPLPMARPGFPGMASSPILNSSTGGTPSPALHTGGVSGQGNSLLRPRDASHMMRPGHNLEHQRPTMAPELPMQTNQGSAQGLSPFNGLSPAFSNPATTPPLQTYTGHTQQPHPHHPHLQVPGPQQQAYAIRIAKERQKQRYMQQQQQQQQQQFATQHQIPSSPMAQPVSVPPLTPSSPMAPIASPHQQKHHLQPGLGQNPQASSNSGLSNQMAKQRQRPTPAQFQQSGRHHLQQRQHGQGKVLKGIGRGNVVNPNLPVDPSRPNGIIAAGEKGEQIMHPVQSQSPYSGSGLNSVQPSKPPVPSQSLNQSSPQQKQNSTQTQTKPLHQIPQLASGNTLSASHQAVAQQPQQQPPLEKPANPTQPIIQRVLQQNRQVQPDQPGGAPVDQAQDQQSVNNAPQIGTASAMPQTCADSANSDLAVPSVVTSQLKVPSVVTSQLKESESGPDFDSGMSDTPTQVARIGSPALSAGNDPIPTFSPRSGQKQLSGSVSSHEHNTVTQRRQHPESQQSLVSSPPSTQQHDPPLEQPSPTLQKERQLDQQSPQPHLSPQQQTQHLQSG